MYKNGIQFFISPLSSTWWEFSLHFVYIFRTDWNFLIKFCSFDPSLNRNIYLNLYLKFKTSACAQTAVIHYYVKLTNFLTWYWIWNLHWGYVLFNEVGQWLYQLDRVTFSKNVSSFVNCARFFYQIYCAQMSTL